VLVPNPPWHETGDFTLANGASATPRRRATLTRALVLSPRLVDAAAAGGKAQLCAFVRGGRTRRSERRTLRGYWNDVGTPERLQASGARREIMES
jgi:MurNAc alpha-1-phosphate uridylyltransferase